jgi:hypothetical protein
MATGSEPTGWSVLRTTGTPPHHRGGHTATLVEKNLLILGGVHHKGAGSFEYFPLEPVVLNTETLAWFSPRVAVGKPPPGRAYHSTTRVGTGLFVFGGQCSKGSQGSSTGLMNDMPVFDLVRMCWETRDVRGQQPRPRYWHTAELIEGKLFIIGGFDGKRSLKDVGVLDVETLLWSTPKILGEPMLPLAQHSATIVGQRLYLFGGMQVQQDQEGHSYNKFNPDVLVLDTESLQLTRLRRRGQQPSGRGYHTCNLVGGYLLVIGGWDGGACGLDKVSTLDIDGLGSWYTVEVPGQSPPAVYGHSATLIGSKVVLFGGWDGVSPLNAVHVLDTAKL